MVSEVIEAPVETVDPAAPVEETENPTPAEEAEVEVAAPDAEPAATGELQVSATEPEKPDYITRAEWEKERAEVAAKAAAEALESDRRRRQTENARRAAQEVREREEQQEAADTIRAALVAQGYDPAIVTDEAVTRTVDRLAKKKADRLTAQSADVVDQAFDYITAPVYGQQVDLDESVEPAARKLAPKIQHLIDTIRPQIEEAARKGYIAESDLPARVEAEIAKRAAKAREGQEPLIRPEGQPASTDELTWWRNLGPEGRKDPANIARFDRYTASQR